MKWKLFVRRAARDMTPLECIWLDRDRWQCGNPLCKSINDYTKVYCRECERMRKDIWDFAYGEGAAV